MDEILSLLRRTRLLSVLFAVAAGLTLLGLILFLAGPHSLGLLIVLLSTQVLIAGGVVILYRALLLRTAGSGGARPGGQSGGHAGAGSAGSSAPRAEDIVQALRAELSARTHHEQELTRLLQQHRTAAAQQRRDLFEETFSDLRAPRS